MYEIHAGNGAEYLRSSGRIEPDASIAVRELAGGVSNVVLLATPDRGVPLVLKQARGRLRVQQEWLCGVERIWREVQVLWLCGELLGQAPPQANRLLPSVPRLLWEDRANFAYAMSAAPPGHATWKELLLAGDLAGGRQVAATCGQLLAALHGGTWNDPDIARQLDDRAFFDQLRLDPYYRQIARVHPQLAPQIARLIDSVWHTRRCLVHGDFSPKNLLVWPGNVMLIDFEVGHCGDPAFDLGFFLTHLVLKAIWSSRPDDFSGLIETFWQSYSRALALHVEPAELVALEARAVMNLAGCLLARIDGKSPVDYLNPQQRDQVRALACRWLALPPAGIGKLRSALSFSRS